VRVLRERATALGVGTNQLLAGARVYFDRRLSGVGLMLWQFCRTFETAWRMEPNALFRKAQRDEPASGIGTQEYVACSE